MKIRKFSIFLVLITCLALLYVHQQVQLLRISYEINFSEKEMSRLLDQNRVLVYNVTRLKSPVYLDNNFLAAKKDYAIPKQWQVIEVAAQKENRRPVAVASLEKKTFGIFKIFGKPREAMANTIK
ncbi:MAG: hypothetical protein PHO42_06570 [Candidatus Omnitrophica bacterium]|nr:hypothetical protein [Candidatus Omnitrophota bacterium]